MSSSTYKCEETNNNTVLSFSTASISAGISFSSILLNFLLIVIFFRHRKFFFGQLFYKIIFNIILADFLNALITDNLTLTYVVKEGLQQPVASIHVTLSHLTFFTFGSVSVVTIGLLGAERQWALLSPFKYRIGIEQKYVWLILVSTWICSILISLLYLWLGFYTSLAIFASTTIVLSFLIMLVTVIVFYQKLIRRFVFIGVTPKGLPRSYKDPVQRYDNVTNRRSSANLSRHFQTSSIKGETNEAVPNETARRVSDEPVHNDISRQKNKKQRPKLRRKNAQPLYCKHVATKVEKRVTKTFIAILFVYIVTYMPTCVMMVYMNVCKSCNCLHIHILRDMTYLSMVSGCLFRPINFLISLRPLKTALSKVCGCK